MKKKGRIFLAVLALAVTGTVWVRVKGIPDIEWFHITEVLVTAEPPLTDVEIRNALPKLVGKNLLAVSGEELMSKLQKLPWVLSASIKKEFPNRLLLTVQSKHPIALKQEGGKLSFLSEFGKEIDRWSAARSIDLDLPVISFEKPEHAKQWDPATLVNILREFQKEGNARRVSQLVASDIPYFKLYLTSPAVEMLFSLHTWEAQLPFFNDLLSRPPRQIGQAHRINLVFPKKAVVSFPLSH